jgi:hypothetical protein
MMIFTVIHQQYLTHHDFAEYFLEIFLEIFLGKFFSLKTHKPTVPAYVNQKKCKKGHQFNVNNYCRGLTKGFYHCALLFVYMYCCHFVCTFCSYTDWHGAGCNFCLLCNINTMPAFFSFSIPRYLHNICGRGYNYNLLAIYVYDDACSLAALGVYVH